MSNDESDDAIESYVNQLADKYDQLFGARSIETRKRSLAAMKKLRNLVNQGVDRSLRRLQFLDLLIAFEERALSEIDQ